MNVSVALDGLYPPIARSNRGWRFLPTSLVARQTLLLWTLGYLLVEISACLQGRSSAGTMFLTCLPLLVSGAAMCIGLDRLGSAVRTRGAGAALMWAIVTVAAVIAGLIQTALDTGLNWFMAMTIFPSWKAWALNLDLSRLTTVYILYLWTVFLSLALAAAVRSATAAQHSAVRAAEADASASQAEAAALRLQLNPHFLFNALNGISSLVVRQQNDDAEDAIGRLADFLRASLANEPGDMVTLARELETAAAYLAVEEGRLGSRLTIQYDVAACLGPLQVPNFIIQPLVENAIKHGAAAHTGQTVLTISANKRDDWALIGVTNCLNGGAMHQEALRSDEVVSHGIGLANTRRRLAVHYGENAYLRCEPLVDGYHCEIGVRTEAAA